MRKGVRIMNSLNKLNVIELFAGVGGFRVGLERANPNFFKTVLGNQWEPSRKAQDAYACYNKHFPGNNSNEDIANINENTFKNLNPDLVVGGFPCQDYSVARSLSGEKGLQGKKGVLFWEIARVLEATNPKYVLLENVDRLLKSPSNQRGRDFAVMLATLRDLDYSVEWRMINAADYGMSQRRRRVFIFAYKNSTVFNKKQSQLDFFDIVFKNGFFAKPFLVKEEPYKKRINQGKLPKDLLKISDEFSFNFHTAGIMKNGEIFTAHVDPVLEEPKTINDILVDESSIDDKYYLTEEQIVKFNYLRGPKKIERISATGHKYTFSEGGMSLIDELDKPGRTMLTSEGTTNRSSHVIEVDGKKRFLTPIECERLNGFPDDWTKGMSDRMRYFCMGNALVIGLIEIMGKRIEDIETNSNKNLILNKKT